MNLLLGTVVSLLPKPCRGWWIGSSTADFRRATILSGFVEAVGCLSVYIARYFNFIHQRVWSIGEAAIKKGAEEALASPTVQFGMGYVSMVEYIFSPLSLLLAYFILEGTLRAFSAALTEETTGTLPLYLVAWGTERVRAWRADRALGPPMVDEVHRFVGLDYHLGIASARPKKDWDRLLTIEFEDKLYELHEEKLGPPPRRHIYLLREIPLGKVIRGIHHYRPDEDLPEHK